MGRPSTYTLDKATKIGVGISGGKSLAAACEGITEPGTAYRWLADNAAFREIYARARESRADARFEAIDQVIDDMRTGKVDAQQARVQIDTIKWQASKELPHRYGDKTSVELSGSLTTMTLAETLRARRAARTGEKTDAQ